MSKSAVAPNIPWTVPEIELIHQWFDNKWTKMTLYQRLQKIAPRRSYEAMCRKIRRLRQEGWTRAKEDAESNLRVGYLDIETTNLKGDWGHMLTWYIKKEGKNEYDFGVITKQEIFDEEFDRRIVIELLEAFKGYDVLWTHYGSDRRFDVPFIRTRAYAHGLEDMLPRHMEMFIKDTYPIARNKLALFSNRLDFIAQALGIKGVKKTPLSPRRWQLARVGNAEALEYIAIHNKRDVQVLEKVQHKLETIDRQPMTSI